MALYDTITFENTEMFAQSIDWDGEAVPVEVIKKILKSNEFQTKGLDCTVGQYIITADEQLKCKCYETYEWVADDNLPIKAAIKQKGEYLRSEDVSKKITIYPAQTIDFLNQDYFVDLELTIYKGHVEKIRCLSVVSTCNARRKFQEAEAAKEIADFTKSRAKLLQNPAIQFYASRYVYPMLSLRLKLVKRHPKFKKIINKIFRTIIPFYRHF